MTTLYNYINKKSKIETLVSFRIIFALMMLYSTIRFISKGWVYEFYVKPDFHFKYYGFSWLEVLPEQAMYAVFFFMLLSCFGILFGCFYRISATVFFLTFTYVELLDQSNYLNHYYFVSLLAFIMIFLPSHKSFSLDVKYAWVKEMKEVPNFYLFLPKLQLSIVYIFAGIAKLNYDWLIQAQPLKIWLPANSHLPIIGSLLNYEIVAYLFSWFGAIYDLFIVFFLLNARTRPYAYFLVIVFHVLTRILFPIGVFPYVMIMSTLIFFSEEIHVSVVNKLKSILKSKDQHQVEIKPISYVNIRLYALFLLFFALQIILPFRYLAYPGKLFWTEQGYRFSWRVMLMEKAGTAFFYVEDSKTKKRIEVDNKEFLTKNQEKMMATQPDMILQYAHYLGKHYSAIGFEHPKVYVESYVNLNAEGSKLFIDTTIDLMKVEDSFQNKEWILNYEN